MAGKYSRSTKNNKPRFLSRYVDRSRRACLVMIMLRWTCSGFASSSVDELISAELAFFNDDLKISSNFQKLYFYSKNDEKIKKQILTDLLGTRFPPEEKAPMEWWSTVAPSLLPWDVVRWPGGGDDIPVNVHVKTVSVS